MIVIWEGLSNQKKMKKREILALRMVKIVHRLGTFLWKGCIISPYENTLNPPCWTPDVVPNMKPPSTFELWRTLSSEVTWLNQASVKFCLAIIFHLLKGILLLITEQSTNSCGCRKSSIFMVSESSEFTKLMCLINKWHWTAGTFLKSVLSC